MMTATRLETSGLNRFRADFPALNQRVHGVPLVYLDSAASSLTPRPVIDAITRIYERDRANVHRGVHILSQRATESYEAARESIRRFVGAASVQEIVFVRGTTEAINLVSQSWARPRLAAGDEILITGLEHHSNIVPWQILCQQTGAKLVVAPVADDGDVPLADIVSRMTDRTKVVAVAHVSNALGTVLPIADIAVAAHARGAVVVVDGAQAAPHIPVDVAALGCDFYALSGHKLYGPTGIGALYGRQDLLEQMDPYQSGGDMIRSVTFEATTYNDLPFKFEAGTPNIAGAVGFGAAVRYLDALGMDAIAGWESHLLELGTERLREIDGLRIIGTAAEKASVISFTLEGVHPHDLGTVIDHYGVALRTGHHCAMPVMEFFGVPATARVSIGLYNTEEEIEILASAIIESRKMFC